MVTRVCQAIGGKTMTNLPISNHANLSKELRESDLNNSRTQRQAARSDIITTDEIIGSLANAYENKRARQVFEWESSQNTKLRQTV